jgi:hypothetical protein
MKNSKRCFKNTLIAALGCFLMFIVSCNKNEEPKSSACEIVLFSVDGKTWTKSGTEFTYVYPPETVEGTLTPTIILSEGATVNPPTSQAQNFFTETGVTYTVTAEDGVTSQSYTAKAIRTRYTGCEILSFRVNNAEWEITDDSLINYVLPREGVEGLLTPVIEISPGATISPASGVEQNFFVPEGVRYTVVSDDGATTKTYIVRARKLSSECSILSFATDGNAWYIDQETGRITCVYEEGIYSPNFIPSITLSPGATIDPPASSQQDFVNNDVIYTVTAEDGTTKVYVARLTATLIVTRSIPGSNCTYKITGVASNLTLVIGGTGDMPDYEANNPTGNRPPWEESKLDITAVVIEEDVTLLGMYTFQDYSNLTSVVIGDAVTIIGWGAFERCERLTSVTLGNSVQIIEGAAFHNCKFTAIDLPASLTTIDFFAFHGCPLTLVINRSPVPQQNFGTRGDYPFGNALDFSRATLRVPYNSINDYRAANVWKDFGTIQNIIE